MQALSSDFLIHPSLVTCCYDRRCMNSFSFLFSWIVGIERQNTMHISLLSFLRDLRYSWLWLNNAVFWEVTTCSLVEINRRFRWTCCFHLLSEDWGSRFDYLRLISHNVILFIVIYCNWTSPIDFLPSQPNFHCLPNGHTVRDIPTKILYLFMYLLPYPVYVPSISQLCIYLRSNPHYFKTESGGSGHGDLWT